MSPVDERRFRALIVEFVAGCDFEPPLHLILIGGNGSASVAIYHDAETVERVCSNIRDDGYSTPVTVCCLSADGRGKSAKIEIVQAGPTLQ